MKKKITYQEITFKVVPGSSPSKHVVSSETVTKARSGSSTYSKRVLRHVVREVASGWMVQEQSKKR